MRPATAPWLATLLLVSACGLLVPDPTPDPLPTRNEAIAFMSELVALAQARDLDGMCQRAGGGNCDEQVESSGGPVAIPAAPPVVAGTRVIPGTSSGDSGAVGGILLVLCGTDGRQRPYRTEMLVSRFRGEIYAINAVYWSGSQLAVSRDTGSASGGAGIECP